MKFLEFKKRFFDARVDKKDLIQRIKLFTPNYQILKKFIQSFEAELKPFKSLLNNSFLDKGALPKSYGELFKIERNYISDEVISELNWQTISFIKNPELINDFLILKDFFENEILLGKYDEAREILEKIENEICISFWSIENRFILDEYQYGSEKNWETRNVVLDEKNDPFVQAFGNLYSIKSEKNVSFFQFNEEMDSWLHLQGQSSDSISQRLIEYLRFKVNYFSYNSYQHFTYFMYKENEASFIDRYLMFIRICHHLISNKDEISNQIIELLRELNYKIKDNSIENVLFIYDEKYNVQHKRSNIISIIDEYTNGNYKKAIELIKQSVNENNANCLELYEIYAKSLIENRDEFQSLTENKSITNRIAKNYFNILGKVESTDDSLIDTVKLSYLFNNSYIGLNLYSFVSNELGWGNDINYNFIAMLSSKFINPRIINTLLNSEYDSNLFINRLKIIYPYSLTVKIYEIYHNNHISKNNLTNFGTIPNIKNKLYQIRNLMLKDMHDDCILAYQNLLNTDNLTIIANYEIVSNLYESYLSKELFQPCLILFVDVYLDNSHLVKRMSEDVLLEKIIKGKFKNIGEIKDLIELPIFFKINCDDKIKIKQTYELFLRNNKCTKPTEILKISNNFQTKKFIFFLKNVCIPEIMQLSKTFDSTYSVNEERIGICKFLTEIDIENIKNYKTEIAELTQKNTISKVIGGIDERKIYVNETKLRQTLKKVQKQNVLQNEQVSPLNFESFDRYVKLLNYVKNNNEYKDISSLIKFDEDGKMVTEENVEINANDFDVVLYLPAFRIFATFFIHIRDLFVFNKEYGLDAYLSTRIRHGTLPNHLRSVFETYSLVTTQTDNIYAENKFWNDRLNISTENLAKLQVFLGSFSKNIDDYSKTIKDKYIQCQSEKRINEPDALFDFSYQDESLIWLFIEEFNNTEEIDDFIDKIFNELWKRTEFCLEKIQTKFNEEYRDSYVKMIDDLQNEILSIEDKSNVSELLNNLMTCRTEIQTKLSNISKWFRRSESSFEGEYKLQILADTSIEITKNIHPNYLFKIETSISENTTVKGEYHQHFIDLFNNCLFNIIKHSNIDSENLNAFLKIEEINNKLELTFENSVSDPENHKSKLEKILENWQLLDTNINEEGGTGFPKVKKIIFSDMNRKSSNFEYNFNGNQLQIKVSFETKDL